MFWFNFADVEIKPCLTSQLFVIVQEVWNRNRKRTHFCLVLTILCIAVSQPHASRTWLCFKVKNNSGFLQLATPLSCTLFSPWFLFFGPVFTERGCKLEKLCLDSALTRGVLAWGCGCRCSYKVRVSAALLPRGSVGSVRAGVLCHPIDKTDLMIWVNTTSLTSIYGCQSAIKNKAPVCLP